jgi:hypothetical protein
VKSICSLGRVRYLGLDEVDDTMLPKFLVYNNKASIACCSANMPVLYPFNQPHQDSSLRSTDNK